MIHFKYKGANKAICWMEIGFEVVAEASLIIAGDSILIDTIETSPIHRNKGYARQIIERLQTISRDVRPIGILPQSRGFWNKLNMTDGLGKEYET